MSTEAMYWAKRTSFGSASKKVIMLVLADYADEDGSCYPGQARIAEQTELGERTVRRLLTELEADGAISREHRQRPNGSRTSDRFYLAGYGWKSAESNRPSTTANRPSTTGQPATVAGPEKSVEAQEEPSGPPIPPTAQLALVPPPSPGRQPTFEDFWQVYPQRTGKGDARRAWAAAVKKAPPADVVAGAVRYRDDPNRSPEYTKGPGAWLRAERWTDDPLPPRAGRSPVSRTMGTARRVAAAVGDMPASEVVRRTALPSQAARVVAALEAGQQ